MSLKIICLYFDREDSLSEIATSLYRLTPDVALGDRAIFLDYSRCQRIYRIESFLLRAKRIASRFNRQFQIGMGENFGSALAFAQYGFSKREDLPIESIRAFYDPFSQNTIPALDEMIRLLRDLGVLRIRDFLEFPKSGLVSRFGKLADWVYSRVSSRAERSWPRFIPPEKVMDRHDFDLDYTVSQLEPILFLMKGMLDRIFSQLRGKGRWISSLLVAFETDDAPAGVLREVHFDFPLAQGSSTGMLPLLRDRLDRLFQEQPLDGFFRSLVLEVKKTSPRISAQRHFLDRSDEEQEQWQSLHVRVTDRIGDQNIFRVEPVSRHLPEASWRRVSAAQWITSTSVTGAGGNAVQTCELPPLFKNLPERPLHLFERPVPIFFSGGSFVSPQKKWKVIGYEGPEHVSGEWWSEKFDRFYYQIKAESGERLWVYHIPAQSQYYLHGFFD